MFRDALSPNIVAQQCTFIKHESEQFPFPGTSLELKLDPDLQK